MELGYAKCDADGGARCDVSSLSAAWMTVTRGSYENPVDGDCGTYFRCKVGYHQRFLPYARVECAPCEGKPVSAQYVSAGLSPNDPSSCLWEEPRNVSGLSSGTGAGRVLPIHEAGWYGTTGDSRYIQATCVHMFTSEANTVLRASDCLACPSVPANAAMVVGSRNCYWRCYPGFTWQGERCIRDWSGVGWPCDGTGMILDGSGNCVASSVPWNQAGHRKVEPRVQVLVNYSQGAVPSEGRVMVPRSAVGGVSGRHWVDLYDSRSSLVKSLPIEGPLCSVTRVWLGGYEYLIGAVCNQSFLVFAELSWTLAGYTTTSTARAQSTTSSAAVTTSTARVPSTTSSAAVMTSTKPQVLRVLIGQTGNSGWADGFKTQARFGTELYVTSGAQNKTVWVLDSRNCLVREVTVWSLPGDYRTRVYSVHGLKDKFWLVPPQPKCYGAGSLASPRRFWEVYPSINGERRRVVLFTDDNGLWQLELETGALSQVMGEGWDLGRRFEADELRSVSASSSFALQLEFMDGARWTVFAKTERCPDDTTSRDGGDCVVGCAWLNGEAGGSYVNQSTGRCVLCAGAAAMGCRVGEEFIRCSRSQPQRCEPCQNITQGLAYVVAGTCDLDLTKHLPPCPRGYYQNGAYCDACPNAGLENTVLGGAVRVEQCKCLGGLRRSHAMGELGARRTCVGEDLYVYDGECVPFPEQCTNVPSDASLVDGTGWGRCAWQCNAGFYREDMARCRACVRTGDEMSRRAASRGDDDEPRSCEFFPAGV